LIRWSDGYYFVGYAIASQQERGAMNIWKLAGALALATVAVAIVVTLPDIRRYIKISNM
jgi:hypothetical protein